MTHDPTPGREEKIQEELIASFILLVTIYISITTMENSQGEGVPEKLQMKLQTQKSHYWVSIPRKGDVYTALFSPAPVTVAKRWNQEMDSASIRDQRNSIQPWKGQNPVISSKAGQAQKDQCHIPHDHTHADCTGVRLTQRQFPVN